MFGYQESVECEKATTLTAKYAGKKNRWKKVIMLIYEKDCTWLIFQRKRKRDRSEMSGDFLMDVSLLLRSDVGRYLIGEELEQQTQWENERETEREKWLQFFPRKWEWKREMEGELVTDL